MGSGDFYMQSQMPARVRDGGHYKVVGGHGRWSEMVAKGVVDGLRTVECLRGRLLAERAASKAAREGVEGLSGRMNEMERLLATEIRARNKAEKRLKRILKKLESLKIIDVSGQFHASEASGSPSSACLSSLQEPEGKPSSHIKDSAQSDADGVPKERGDLLTWEHFGDESSDTMSPGSIEHSISQEESWVSSGTSHSSSENHPSPEETKEIENSLESIGNGELRTDTTSEEATNGKAPNEAQHQINEVDDRLALVPARIWEEEDDDACKPRKSSDVEGCS